MNEFDKIIGYETVKKELYQIIDMIKNKELYEKMGAKLPHGVMIYGRPGVGKTMLANAILKESGVKYFTIKKDKIKRETIKEINETFNKAKDENVAIILIDDIDKFSEAGYDFVDDETFAAIQAGIDSIKDNNILVIATSNKLTKLPHSLLRSGRFDRKIYLKHPTTKDARKIIEHYLKDKCVDPNLNYEDLSKMISYSSCADLEMIVNESAIYAVSERKDFIDINDLTKSYLRGLFVSPDEDYECSEEELEEIALHEAGHAVIAEVIKDGSVGFVTVKSGSRDSIGGFTHICEESKRRDADILISLGGKAATELFYKGRCGYGCESDIVKAFTRIRDDISESGTLGFGMIDVADDRFPRTSESLVARNEAVVHAELERYMFKVREILIDNKDFLLNLAKELKEKGVLHFSDIQEIKKNYKINPISM